LDIPFPPQLIRDYITTSTFEAPILGLNSVTRQDVSNDRVGTGSNIHGAHSTAAFFNMIVDWKPFEHYTVLQSGVAGLEYHRTIPPEPGGTGTRFTISIS
jgi:hypothetical protein